MGDKMNKEILDKIRGMKTSLGIIPDDYKFTCMGDYHLGFGHGYNEAINDVLDIIECSEMKK